MEQRNITFNNQTASLVTVVMHDPMYDTLYTGHAGILLEENNECYLIEKLAPNMPYQVSKYKSKEDMGQELLERKSLAGDPDAAPNMIFVNNKPLSQLYICPPKPFI